MTKILQDIWILNTAGICMFKRVYDEKVDTQLFSGFLSALDSMAISFNEGGLSNFDLKGKRFTIIKNGSYMFVANYDKNLSRKKASNELATIVNKFLNKYDVDELVNWDGDVSFFEGFMDEIKDSLEDPVKMFKDALF
ncbi:MAG: hypothetical protein ACFFCS_08800 [Candidatus Hodarchaeota archaeon]